MRDTAGQSVVHLSRNHTATCNMRAFLRANLLSSSAPVCVCVCVCGLCWQLISFFLEYGSAVPGIDYRGTTGDAPHRKLLHSLGPLTLTAWKVLSTQSRTETEHLLNYLSTISGTEQVVQTRPQKDKNDNNESIQITFRSFIFLQLTALSLQHLHWFLKTN